MKRIISPITVLLISTFFFTVCLWNSCDAITEYLKIWLYENNVGLSSWLVYHGVVACSFGLVPIASYLLFKFGQFNKDRSWILIALGMYFLSILIIVFVGWYNTDSAVTYYGEKKYVINHPFTRFWDFGISGAAFLAAFIFFMISYLHRNRVRKLVSQEVID